jgi:hypothetical protein
MIYSLDLALGLMEVFKEALITPPSPLFSRNQEKRGETCQQGSTYCWQERAGVRALGLMRKLLDEEGDLTWLKCY